MNTMPSPDFDHLLFHATTSRGHEPILQRELQDFGAQATRLIPGGVEFEGDITLGMRTCLWSRVCNRVHVRIGEDRLRNEKQLYQSVRALPLAQWFHPDFPIVVHAQARGAIVTNSMYATMVAKDAVCDAMRDLYGRRPGVDRENDLATALDVQIINERVYYGISLQGAPLHKRGYRARDIDAHTVQRNRRMQLFLRDNFRRHCCPRGHHQCSAGAHCKGQRDKTPCTDAVAERKNRQ